MHELITGRNGRHEERMAEEERKEDNKRKNGKEGRRRVGEGSTKA